jgi:hypothetical protein
MWCSGWLADEDRGTDDMSKLEPARDDDPVWERVLLRKENAPAALLSIFLSPLILLYR